MNPGTSIQTFVTAKALTALCTTSTQAAIQCRMGKVWRAQAVHAIINHVLARSKHVLSVFPLTGLA